MAGRSLALCVALERRCWFPPHWHPLRQLTPRPLNPEIAYKLEQKGKAATLDRLVDMSGPDLGALIRNINQGPRVLELAKSIPRVSLAASLQPITSSILRICLTVRADFERRSYNEAEPFWIWVEDENCEWIFHSERLMLTKRLENHARVCRPRFRSYSCPVLRPRSSRGARRRDCPRALP